MKIRRTTHKALAILTVAVATQAAMFGVVAQAHAEATGFYVLYRMPSGYLARTETHPTQAAAFSHFKKAIITNELAITRN